jgi:hypothetical protein
LFRYKKCTSNKAGATDGDANGNGDDDGNTDDELAAEQDPDFEAGELATIENANKHCRRSICQRKLANEKIAKAKKDKMNNVSHSS